MMTKPTKKAVETVFPSRLAIDPGHTIGIAYMAENEVVFTGAVSHKNFGLEVISSLLDIYQPQEVIMETVPTMYPDKITIHLFAIIKEEVIRKGYTLLTVSPGVWKPVRTNPKPFWREHIRDAVSLLYHR